VSDASLGAVASRSRESAEAFAQTMGVHRAYSSYEELLSQPDIDVVYIATPHIRHHTDCLLALEAGKSVLCEKPFTMNAHQAREVFDLARSRNLFCMEAMWMRFIPLMQQVRHIIKNDEIGEIKLLSADFGYPVPFDAKSRLFNRELGGGALLDRGVYPLSLAVSLMGKPNRIVGQASIGSTGVDEQSAMVLHYDHGALATLSSTLLTYGSNTATIMGTRGQIVIHPPFYYPEKVSIDRFPDTQQMKPTPRSSASTSLKERVKVNLKMAPFFKRLRRLKPHASQSLVRLEAGQGYHHQVVEVGRCLRAGRVESSLMPWIETLQVMESMDTLRESWSLTYAQDEA